MYKIDDLLWMFGINLEYQISNNGLTSDVRMWMRLTFDSSSNVYGDQT